jgi:hypothetical protein
MVILALFSKLQTYVSRFERRSILILGVRQMMEKEGVEHGSF